MPQGAGETPPGAESLSARLHELERKLSELAGPAEGTAATEMRRVRDAAEPAWRRVTRGEPRWPASLGILAMIALQLALPDRLSPVNRALLPAIELALLVVLVAANPRRIERTSRRLRALSLALIGVASLANAWSVAHLVASLVQGSTGNSAGPLLATGANVWLTNVLVFALWYWELDRGGPAARAVAADLDPDFLFPQMATPETHVEWEPQFLDYLYVAFTNAAAFSPTDTMPLSRGAKAAMMLQEAVSLITAGLVIARAVNVLH